ncbi:MAG: patatin-like phospholipase family protein [Beijerinckiaceae bacterium]
MFAGVSFPGGGNRCYWQGGFWEIIAPALALKPVRVVGVSGGAFAASYALLGIGEEVRAKVIEGCRLGLPNFDRTALKRREHPFPVAGLYRRLIDETLTEARLHRIQSETDLQIMVAHPPGFMPAPLAAAVGLAAYQLEKKIRAPVHPVLGRRIGFRATYLPVRAMTTAVEWADAVYASASVPPVMPITQVSGRTAIDGGMVDNVPVEPLEELEAQGERTLVLLTRRYKKLPAVAHRTYVQPSQAIPVGQFTITNPDAILAAHAQGRADGVAFLRTLK